MTRNRAAKQATPGRRPTATRGIASALHQGDPEASPSITTSKTT